MLGPSYSYFKKYKALRDNAKWKQRRPTNFIQFYKVIPFVQIVTEMTGIVSAGIPIANKRLTLISVLQVAPSSKNNGNQEAAVTARAKRKK